jgi:Flp pilus assembly protein TadG
VQQLSHSLGRQSPNSGQLHGIFLPKCSDAAIGNRTLINFGQIHLWFCPGCDMGTVRGSLLADNQGGLSAIFALILPVLLMCLAFGVDMSRMYSVNMRVKESLDAATLAAAKLLDQNPNASQSEIQTLAQAYFNANVDATHLFGATLANFRATPDFSTGTVSATVDVNVPTLFARSAGSVTSVPFQRGAAANLTSVRVEVVLVLDNTGSMADPFPGGTTKLDALKATAKSFIDALYVDNPKLGFVRVALAPYSDALNAGGFANTVAGFGFDTCVVDRGGAYAYTDEAALNFFSRVGRSNIAQYNGYLCPSATIQPLTDLTSVAARQNFKNAIDGMTPGGGTAGHIGAAWGWYLTSPKWAPIFGSQAGLPYSTNVQKIIVLLTDGVFNTAYNNGGLNLPGTGNGAVTDPALDPLRPGSSPYQALQLCANMKAAAPAGQEITIYTIGVLAPVEAEALLKSCSGVANFYSVGTTSGLEATFRSIADRVTRLRITS